MYVLASILTGDIKIYVLASIRIYFDVPYQYRASTYILMSLISIEASTYILMSPVSIDTDRGHQNICTGLHTDRGHQNICTGLYTYRGHQHICTGHSSPATSLARCPTAGGPLKAPGSPGINGVKSCILAISWQQNWPFRNYNLIQKITNFQNIFLKIKLFYMHQTLISMFTFALLSNTLWRRRAKKDVNKVH
jgi:hypothetical protein